MSSHSIAAFTHFHQDEMQAIIEEWRRRHVVAEVDGEVDYKSRILIFRRKKTVVVWMRELGDVPWDIYSDAGSRLQCPWLHLQFQEKIVWEYTLYQGEDELDCFVPAPELWDEGKLSLGKPELLAKIWSVNVGRISRYSRRWSPELPRRRAYWWRDRALYGEFEQGYDFLYALTGIRIE